MFGASRIIGTLKNKDNLKPPLRACSCGYVPSNEENRVPNFARDRCTCFKSLLCQVAIGSTGSTNVKVVSYQVQYGSQCDPPRDLINDIVL